MTKEIKDVFHAYESVCFAYLFGSYVKGEYTKSSDIDVAVYFKRGTDLFDAKLSLHHALEKALRKPVDLIVLNTIKNYDLLNDIFNEGVVLIDRDPEERMAYEVQKEHEIKDYDVFKRMLNVA